MFQSIAGTQLANEGFGISLDLLQEGYEATLSLKRGTIGQNVMYFETGQGSALSSNAHHGVDQQTLETRAYAVVRKYNPLLVNTVVGFIGTNISLTVNKLYVRDWKITSAVSYLACQWAATFVIPTMQMPTKMIWMFSLLYLVPLALTL